MYRYFLYECCKISILTIVDSFHISGDNLGSYFVSTTAMQYEQRSNPSLAWLMPRPELWDQDQVLVQVKCNVCNQVNDKSLGTRYEWYKYVVRVVQLHIFQKVQVTANKMVHLKRSLFWTSYLWFDESVKLQRPPFYVANCQKWVCRQSVASVQWSCGANYYCNKAEYTMWKGTKI